MSITNNDRNEHWELGDAIPIELDDTDDTDDTDDLADEDAADDDRDVPSA
ncbi:hypothetical protein BH24ACT5_BH24ACT5_19460 [soil metagenome]